MEVYGNTLIASRTEEYLSKVAIMLRKYFILTDLDLLQMTRNMTEYCVLYLILLI